MSETLLDKECEIEKPYISVIIIAHNRKEFILKAVNSAINQLLERSKYEIIVVKNYLDDNIDKFLNEHNIKDIYTERITLGDKIAYGIEKSEGEIICLLEDDDLFLPEKLNEIYNIFQKSNKVILVRNNIFKTVSPETIKNSIKINSEIFDWTHEIPIANINSVKDIFFIIRKYGVGNTSSISIRRNFYIKSLEHLKSVNYLIEFFLFFYGIFNGNDDNTIIFQQQILSIYRMHNSWTQVSADRSVDDFIEHNLLVSYQGVEAYEKFKTFFITNIILDKYLTATSKAWRVQIKIITCEKVNMSELISLIRVGVWRRSSEILLSVPLIFISFINRNYASNVFKKILKKVQSIPTK